MPLILPANSIAGTPPVHLARSTGLSSSDGKMAWNARDMAAYHYALLSRPLVGGRPPTGYASWDDVPHIDSEENKKAARDECMRNAGVIDTLMSLYDDSLTFAIDSRSSLSEYSLSS